MKNLRAILAVYLGWRRPRQARRGDEREGSPLRGRHDGGSLTARRRGLTARRGGASSALVFYRLELRLVDAFLVGLFACHLSLVQELLDRRIHGTHAECTAGLHHVLELIELALADEVLGGGSVHQDLQRS